VLDGSSGGSFAARLKRTAPDQARAVEFVGDARADAPAVAILSSPDALRSREPEDATERMQQRCLEAGMDACMTKPIDAQRLLATIEQFIASPSADLAPGSREPASVARLTRGGDREASLDEERLRELEALGGTGFLREMLSTLMTEVETLTIDLQRAQGQNDLFLFRDVAHSIRSCAANLGAEPLARQAERLEYLPAETFARQGAADLNALVEQATRLRHDIGRRLAH
jgi:two-component system sensor histidine kinase RpfC